VWDGLGFSAASAPPHISLKQPFPVANLAEMEAYFEQFAAGIPAFNSELARLEAQIMPAPNQKQKGIWMSKILSPTKYCR